jgi:hypothetical protein
MGPMATVMEMSTVPRSKVTVTRMKDTAISTQRRRMTKS